MLTRRSLAAALAGAALGLALTAVDPGPADPLRLPAGNVRALLASMLGALITVAAVLFWIRGTFVQLAAAEFPARVVQGHLSGRHERRALPFLVGAFAYTAVVLLALPETGRAPSPASLVAVLLSLSAFLAVVRTIEVGLRMSQTSTLVLALARHAVSVLDSRLPAAGDGAGAHVDPKPGRPERPVAARRSGWVHALDEDALLAALPAGATLALRVAPGSLVTPGGVVAEVEGAEGAEDAVEDALDRALALADHRPADDIDLVLRELVDVTLQSLAPGAADATRGYEAIGALGWVLGELLSRDLPPLERRTGQRVLLRLAEPSHGERLRSVLEPLTEAAGPWAGPGRALARAVTDAAERLDRRGLPARAALLREAWEAADPSGDVRRAGSPTGP